MINCEIQGIIGSDNGFDACWADHYLNQCWLESVIHELVREFELGN